MREIKFRKWSKEINRYLPDDNGFYWLKANKYIEFMNKEDVIEQYTGIEDEGNTEIFEGDILKDIYDGTVIGSVEYIDDYAMFWCGTMPLYDVAPDGQVCGNIHEDNELLGEQE